ncbi:Stress response protein [Podosphaera aphanis]|nr:Stress response protein [Podosphaera aphanis]
MPSIRRQQTVQSSAAVGLKQTSKYAVKDNEKLVSASKNSQNTEPSDQMPAMTQSSKKSNVSTPAHPESNGTLTVNRKKQKRREKEAAKRAAAGQQPAPSVNGAPASAAVRIQMQELEARFREQRLDQQYNPEQQFEPGEDDPYYSDEAYSGSFRANGSPQNCYRLPSSHNSTKKSKKKRKSKGSQSRGVDKPQTNGSVHNHIGLPLPPLGPKSLPRGPGISKEKIWNTSSQEERERIREFWLSLGEDERKSLVKVEKDAVLKKMKEQQKHSCSCTVCGRKRTAIEEELEVLYDAYYEELEQYANHRGDAGHPMMHPRRFGAISALQPPNLLPPAFNPHQASRGRIVEQLADDEEDDEADVGGDEEFSEEEGDEEDEDDYSDDEPEELPRSHAADFFNFGNSLTVQGGILTVADDLLKNDGKKFIEMMEQLAERRMAREEDAREQFTNANYGQPPNAAAHPHPHSHNHPNPPEEEEEEDEEEEEEEEEEEYDSQDEDYDEEEIDTMTEEQRMEEGRRMFQIFAARMFEQRVLTAYKKKVSEERTQRLLEELEEETKAKTEKQAKKARDAQKKKERLAQKKQALAEEKARREAEEAKKLAALRLAEEKKAEEARNKAEEKRKRKEALKKAEEEERLRKEAEKARRLQEQRERQAEQERKQRETKERERKEKDEQRQREKKARGVKEREAKDRRERIDREKQEREKLENEAKEKAEKEALEKQKREKLALTKETPQANSNSNVTTKRASIPISTSLQSHPITSPHIPIVTPAVPKAPTPIKLRGTSQQDSNSPAPHTAQNDGPGQITPPAPQVPLQESSRPIGPPPKLQNQYPYLHHPQATSPIHSTIKSPPGILPPPNQYGNMQPLNSMPFPPGMPIMAPGFGRMPHEPVFPPHQGMGTQFRPLIGPNGIPMSMNMHQIPQGRGFPIQHAPPGFSQGIPTTLGGISQSFGVQKDHIAPQSHSRQQSGNIDPSTPQAQPIARPAPIGRPASVVYGQHSRDMKNEIDDLSNHLGSSALLDDSDEPLNSRVPARRLSVVPRQNFVPPFGIGQSAFANPITSYSSWGGPPNLFGPSSLPEPGFIGGWPSAGFMVGSQNSRTLQSRPVGVRLMICRACRNLEGTTPDGYSNLNAIKDQVEQMCPPNEPPITEKEILDICETEGNAINGGGSFDVREDSVGNWSIRYEDEIPSHRPLGAPGEIGSPIVGNGGLARFPSTNPPPGF